MTIIYEIRATFSDGKSTDLGVLQHPALIGDMLMGWTQRLQRTRFPLIINIRSFPLIAGAKQPQIGGVEATFNRGMLRPNQIRLIDELVGWARNQGQPIPVPATDEYWLYWRK